MPADKAACSAGRKARFGAEPQPLMSFHSQLVTLLKSLDAVTAIVGAGDAARIRPDGFQKRDGEIGRAAILIEVDRQEHLNDLQGRGGLVVGEVTITCRAATRAASDALAEAVRTNGTDPGTGLAGYASTLLDLVVEDHVKSWVPKGDGSEDGWYDTLLTLMPIYPEVE